MRALLGAAVLVCACAHAEDRQAQRDNWRSAHPQAAGQLCSFARDYPSESTRMRQWARDHPIQARQLIDWSAENPGANGPPEYLFTPPGFNGYRPSRDPNIYALLNWAANHPQAAHELAEMPGGIEWALDGRDC